ncbi:MAG: hypothetical protein PHP23_04625 [Desulfobacterales bacterium]|nr:hypothetical protein [Desulfobacterales bacterium]MDD4071671.1 hypothetical protein [Desulfobacterales bacterium]MDD4393582.1 hypothetical protein [Desulfobacterales bacterium]
MATLEEAMKEARKNSRVCPQPMRWQELYEMLPDKRRKGGGWEPALPLILAAWWDTSALQKKVRFCEHIKWASAHGDLDIVYRFIVELTESEWHHIGE